MNTTIQWLTTAFDRLVAFVPQLVAGLVILLLGWVVGSVLGRIARGLGHRLGFDRMLAKLGVTSPSEPAAGSRRLGSLVFAVVMLVAVMQAARVWELGFVAAGLAAIVAYLPHALAAAVVFSVSLLVGNWARDRFYRARAEATAGPSLGVEIPRVLPGLVRGVIIAVGAFMALRELQIAPEIVNAAFMFSLGAIAVAGALAFGLGAREVAGRVAMSWWERRTYGRVEPTPPEPMRPGVQA